jgi:hypothetical protein
MKHERPPIALAGALTFSMQSLVMISWFYQDALRIATENYRCP